MAATEQIRGVDGGSPLGDRQYGAFWHPTGQYHGYVYAYDTGQHAGTIWATGAVRMTPDEARKMAAALLRAAGDPAEQ